MRLILVPRLSLLRRGRAWEQGELSGERLGTGLGETYPRSQALPAKEGESLAERGWERG